MALSLQEPFLYGFHGLWIFIQMSYLLHQWQTDRSNFAQEMHLFAWLFPRSVKPFLLV